MRRKLFNLQSTLHFEDKGWLGHILLAAKYSECSGIRRVVTVFADPNARDDYLEWNDAMHEHK